MRPTPLTVQPPLVARCDSLQEVRTRIDQTDRQLVALLAERVQYVRQAARFKQTLQEVQAPQRVEQVVRNALAHARDVGAPAEVIEATYRALISALIREEESCLRPLATDV